MAYCYYVLPIVGHFKEMTLWYGRHVTGPGNLMHGAGLIKSLSHSVMTLKMRSFE